MIAFKIKHIFLTIILLSLLNSCSSLPGGDARKNPPDPKERVSKNLEEEKRD